MNCEVCGMLDADKPMVFKGYPWCSDDHRKIVLRHQELAEQMYAGVLGY